MGHSEADDTTMVTVWMAVSDATKGNGCLQVIPRTASTGLLPHCAKTQTAIADDFLDESRAVPLPVRSGAFAGLLMCAIIAPVNQSATATFPSSLPATTTHPIQF